MSLKHHIFSLLVFLLPQCLMAGGPEGHPDRSINGGVYNGATLFQVGATSGRGYYPNGVSVGSLAFSADLEHMLFQMLGFAYNYSFQVAGENFTFSQNRGSRHFIGLNFHPRPYKALDPFLGIQPGIVRSRSKPTSQSDWTNRQNDPVFSAVLGLNYWPGYQARVRVMGQVRWTSDFSDQFRPMPTDEWSFGVGVGLIL